MKPVRKNVQFTSGRDLFHGMLIFIAKTSELCEACFAEVINWLCQQLSFVCTYHTSSGWQQRLMCQICTTVNYEDHHSFQKYCFIRKGSRAPTSLFSLSSSPYYFHPNFYSLIILYHTPKWLQSLGRNIRCISP